MVVIQSGDCFDTQMCGWARNISEVVQPLSPSDQSCCWKPLLNILLVTDAFDVFLGKIKNFHVGVMRGSFSVEPLCVSDGIVNWIVSDHLSRMFFDYAIQTIPPTLQI